MNRFVGCFFLLLMLSVSFGTHARQSQENRFKLVSTEVFDVQVPKTWGLHIEDGKGQFAAAPEKRNKTYPSPWLIIEYCLFRHHMGNSEVKRCEEPLNKCPTEAEFRTVYVEEKSFRQWLPMTTTSKGEELLFSRKSIDPSDYGGMQLFPCSSKGISVVSLIYEGEQDLIELESVLMSFRWH